MNGKKARALRTKARAAAIYAGPLFRESEGGWASGNRGTAKYRDGHYRRIYQDSKRTTKGRTA